MFTDYILHDVRRLIIIYASVVHASLIPVTEIHPQGPEFNFLIVHLAASRFQQCHIHFNTRNHIHIYKIYIFIYCARKAFMLREFRMSEKLTSLCSTKYISSLVTPLFRKLNCSIFKQIQWNWEYWS